MGVGCGELGTIMICDCTDWSENIEKVNAPLLLQAARSGFNPAVRYDGKLFTHCPWCGNPLKESEADSVSGGNAHATSVSASPDSSSPRQNELNFMENSEPQSQGSEAKQKEIDDLRSENAFMERMGYVLAMRLLQTDIELDGEESGAISVFVPKTPSVGRGNAAGAAPIIPKSALPASTQGAPDETGWLVEKGSAFAPKLSCPKWRRLVLDN